MDCIMKIIHILNYLNKYGDEIPTFNATNMQAKASI